MLTRRKFSTNLALTAAATTMTAKSYANIAGANDRVNFAVCGLNGRGYAHLAGLGNNRDKARIAYICDVDTTIMDKYTARATKALGYTPVAHQDFRKVLDLKDVDAITVATPDHWHAPMAILGLRAGKHVYCEKPSSHNPREGELLIEAQQKYNKCVQVGDQQRSSPHTIKMVGMIKDGVIGNAYQAKAWYTNNRKPTYYKPAPVPSTLNWDLWQGPAPRSAYMENIHPYNWHWLFRYGTGESLNNGTHEVDVARWLLGLGYPEKVTASAGRYAFKDDWQFYDTMVTSYEYPGKSISWEGYCCNNMPIYGRGRGVIVHGTTGSVIIDRDGYEVFDLNGKKTDEFKDKATRTATQDTIGADTMTDLHFANFIAGIRTGEALHSPIPIANVSVTMVQLSNIAWRVGRNLKINTADGHVLNDPEAMKLWSRDYEKGWEPKV